MFWFFCVLKRSVSLRRRRLLADSSALPLQIRMWKSSIAEVDAKSRKNVCNLLKIAAHCADWVKSLKATFIAKFWRIYRNQFTCKKYAFVDEASRLAERETRWLFWPASACLSRVSKYRFESVFISMACKMTGVTTMSQSAFPREAIRSV